MIEFDMIETVRQVTSSVRIPVAVKVAVPPPSPSSPSPEQAGAKGIVLFNRFYQPDFNLDELDVTPHLRLLISPTSAPALAGHPIAPPDRLRCPAPVAFTKYDVVKALLAGANTVQLVSVLLKHGPQVLSVLRDGLVK